MHLLINALSARALSGWYVLNGHLQEIASQTHKNHQVTLLADRSQLEKLTIPDHITPYIVDENLSSWQKRWFWERKQIAQIARRLNISAVLNVSGTVTGNLPVPEYAIALNPWAMIDQIPKTSLEKIKSLLQRAAYRRAMQKAHTIFFCSEHLRQLYLSNCRQLAKAQTKIVHIGLEQEVFTKADEFARSVPKDPFLILGVSAWAPWKGADRLVALLAAVKQSIPEAHLRLVGPWPDANYRKIVDSTITELKLAASVEITGPVAREELLMHYAEAKLFALLSGAESYGIPALEAQAFGTPTLGATDCAMPEITNGIGFFTSLENLKPAADFVIDFLSQPEQSNQLATLARKNAQKYHWQEVAKPLIESLNLQKSEVAIAPVLRR